MAAAAAAGGQAFVASRKASTGRVLVRLTKAHTLTTVGEHGGESHERASQRKLLLALWDGAATTHTHTDGLAGKCPCRLHLIVQSGASWGEHSCTQAAHLIGSRQPWAQEGGQGERGGEGVAGRLKWHKEVLALSAALAPYAHGWLARACASPTQVTCERCVGSLESVCLHPKRRLSLARTPAFAHLLPQFTPL